MNIVKDIIKQILEAKTTCSIHAVTWRIGLAKRYREITPKQRIQLMAMARCKESSLRAV